MTEDTGMELELVLKMGETSIKVSNGPTFGRTAVSADDKIIDLSAKRTRGTGGAGAKKFLITQKKMGRKSQVECRQSGPRKKTAVNFLHAQQSRTLALWNYALWIGYTRNEIACISRQLQNWDQRGRHPENFYQMSLVAVQPGIGSRNLIPQASSIGGEIA